MLKTNLPVITFSDYNPIISHPLFVNISLFVFGFTLRFYYLSVLKKFENQINTINQGVTKVLQESNFSIAQLRAERDEEGNIVQLIVEKVNNNFEAAFKINLYEVQEQKADYIFDLIFKTRFDLNKYIYNPSKQKKSNELHAVAWDRWLNRHGLQ